MGPPNNLKEFIAELNVRLVMHYHAVAQPVN